MAADRNPDLLDARPLIAAAGTGWHAIGGVPIRTLCPADEFAYLCVHGARSTWFRLNWIADVYALIECSSADEREELYRHAAERGVRPCVDLALALCARLFGLDLPPQVRTRVEADWRLRALRGLCLAGLRSPRYSLWRLFAVNMLLALCHGYARSELARWMIGFNDVLDSRCLTG